MRTAPSYGLAFVLFLVGAPPKAIPSVAIMPASQIVRSGETARFAVVTEGEPSFNFQWRLNGARLDLSVWLWRWPHRHLERGAIATFHPSEDKSLMQKRADARAESQTNRRNSGRADAWLY